MAGKKRHVGALAIVAAVSFSKLTSAQPVMEWSESCRNAGEAIQVATGLINSLTTRMRNSPGQINIYEYAPLLDDLNGRAELIGESFKDNCRDLNLNDVIAFRDATDRLRAKMAAEGITGP